MTTNYPTSIDTFVNPTSNDSLNSPSHSQQHANLNDAMIAVQTKLGYGNANKVGLYLTASTTFTGASAINIDNCFNSTYNNYKIIFNITQSSNASQNMLFRLRTASGDDNSAIYNRGIIAWNLGSTTASGGGLYSDTAGLITYGYYAANPLKFALDINGINSNVKSFGGFVPAGSAASDQSGLTINLINGAGAGTHTGISIYPSAAITYTGSILVYGYRNS